MIPAGPPTGIEAMYAAESSSTFTTAMGHVAQAFEVLGALILVVGVIWSTALSIVTWRRARNAGKAYTALRRALGGTLLLALEILVAADLIRTVAVEPTLDNVLVLGLIVVIRTFLSFSLSTEIDGAAPWRRAALTGAAAIRRANQETINGQ